MTEPDLSVVLERYNFNRQKEREYREIAETYEIQIIKNIILKQVNKEKPKIETNPYRSRTKKGRWRKKRSDTGVKRLSREEQRIKQGIAFIFEKEAEK